MIVHILISGRVQGVGFRQFVRHHARKEGLAGWVKNLPDGRVEAVFVGEENKVRKLVGLSKKGPFISEVENIEVDWNHNLSADIIEFSIIKQ